MKIVTKKDVEAAERYYSKAMKRRYDVQHAYHVKNVLPKMRRKVGECYRYRNTHGSGEPWWLYARIIGATEDGFALLHVQTYPDGRASAEIDMRSSSRDGDLESGYEPISADEYHAGAKPTLDRLVKAAGLDF